MTSIDSGRIDNSRVNKGGIFGFLDLPAGSTLSVNGVTITLKREDFVAVHAVPVQLEGVRFNFVTVLAAPISERANSAGAVAVTVGFVFLCDDGMASHESVVPRLIRRYNPQVEEVGSTPVDKETSNNLVRQIYSGQLDLQRFVAYDQIVSQAKDEAWLQQTKFISRDLLRRRRIGNGVKIVPGAFDQLDEEEFSVVDGIAVRYCPIPIFSKANRLTLHEGTKRFLKNLTPSERTALLTSSHPSKMALSYLLSNEYDFFQDIVGDVQLSFVMFIHLHCFSSLSHWRDLVAMLSSVDAETIATHAKLYTGFLGVLRQQISERLDDEFLDDSEFSRDNFLIPALSQLLETACRAIDQDSALRASLGLLTTTLQQKYPLHFQEAQSTIYDSEDEDDDGPQVVTLEEIDASLLRSVNKYSQSSVPPKYDPILREQYPMIFAAMQDSEDLLMTCARVLDEARDVSLVREAASYLEEVESKKF